MATFANRELEVLNELQEKPTKQEIPELLKRPEVKQALKKAVDKGDAEQVIGQKLKPKQKKQVKKEIEKASPSSKFSQALASITPQLIGMAVGGLVGGGTEGLAAGGELAMQQQAAQAQLQQKQAETALKQMAVEADIKRDEWERDLGERKVAVAEKEALASLAATYAKANPGTRARIDGLKGEDKKVMSFTTVADRAMNDMVSALEEGENTFEVIGTTKFTDARDRFINAMLRKESGAAISDEEYDRFKRFVPGMTDSEATVRAKMQRNRQAIDDTLNIYGISRGDLGLPTPISLKSKEEVQSRIAELKAKRGF